MHRCTEPTVQPRKSISDGRPTLIDQFLGRFAVGKIERRTELGCGDADDLGAKALRQLPGNFQPRLVGLAERQPDHHRRIIHCCLLIAVHLRIVGG